MYKHSQKIAEKGQISPKSHIENESLIERSWKKHEFSQGISEKSRTSSKNCDNLQISSIDCRNVRISSVDCRKVQILHFCKVMKKGRFQQRIVKKW